MTEVAVRSECVDRAVAVFMSRLGGNLTGVETCLMASFCFRSPVDPGAIRGVTRLTPLTRNRKAPATDV